MFGLLGESFPNDMRENFSNSMLRIGTVLKAKIEIANKEKRIIIIGVNKNGDCLATVLINSELNTNIFNTPELINEVVELDSDGRKYLDRASYVNCSQIVALQKSTMQKHIKDYPESIIGFVDDSDIKRIHNKISSSRIITNIQKKYFDLYYSK